MARRVGQALFLICQRVCFLEMVGAALRQATKVAQTSVFVVKTDVLGPKLNLQAADALHDYPHGSSAYVQLCPVPSLSVGV